MVNTAAIPDRFAATGTDAAVSITRAVTQHRIGVCLTFDERLDADRLARAVRLSLDAEPILGCSFETDAFKPYWRRLSDLDAALPFSFLETDDPEGEVARFQAEEIENAGAQAAVRLLRSPHRDELGIKLSHVAADGQAAKGYAYLLAEIYTRLGSDPSYVPEPNLAARPTGKDVWKRLSPDQRRDAKKAKSWAVPTWDIPFEARSGEGVAYRSMVLEPECFAVLRAYGKERAATVNDMLLAAFFRACVRAFEPASGVPLSLMCTADLRRYLPDTGRLPIANISISGSLDIERVEDEEFDDTLRRVRERMGVWAKTCYGARPALNAEKITALGYKMTKRILETTFRMSGGSGKSYPWFTNIGVLEESKLWFDGCTPIAGSMYGPAAFGASIVPTVSTYRNTLTICMGFCARDVDSAVIDRVLQLVQEELGPPTRLAPHVL